MGRSLRRKEQAPFPSNVPNCMTLKTLESFKIPGLILAGSQKIEFFFSFWGKLLKFQARRRWPEISAWSHFFLEIQKASG
jgi:hypothetical protein